MLDKKTYEKIVEKGTNAENMFLKYMESDGFSFIAGDINRETINPEYFEECFSNCRLIPSTEKRGARLAFYNKKAKREVVFIMPDGLYLHNKKGILSFFDVKSRRINNLKEKKYKLIEYFGVSKYSYVNCYIAIVVYEPKSEGYNIYIDNVSKYVSEEDLERFEITGWFEDEDVEFDISKMWKFNKKPIKADI